MLTTKCNFACTYCYERDLVEKHMTLTDDQLSAGLDFIKKHVKKKKNLAKKAEDRQGKDKEDS